MRPESPPPRPPPPPPHVELERIAVRLAEMDTIELVTVVMETVELISKKDAMPVRNIRTEIVRLLLPNEKRLQMMPTKKLLPIGFVARRLRITKDWLLSEAIAGRIPALHAGSRWLCDPEAVEAALLERAR